MTDTNEREREARAREQAHGLLDLAHLGADCDRHGLSSVFNKSCKAIASALVAHAREVDALKAEVKNREADEDACRRALSAARGDLIRVERERGEAIAARDALAAELLALRVEHGRFREALTVIQRVASPPPVPRGTPKHLVPNMAAIAASIARLAREAVAAKETP